MHVRWSCSRVVSDACSVVQWSGGSVVCNGGVRTGLQQHSDRLAPPGTCSTLQCSVAYSTLHIYTRTQVHAWDGDLIRLNC